MTLPADTLLLLCRYIQLDKKLVEATFANDPQYSEQLRMQQHRLWFMIPQSVKESGLIDRWLSMHI